MRPGMESAKSPTGFRPRGGVWPILLLVFLVADLGCSHLNHSAGGGPRYRREGHAPLVNRFKRMGGHLRGHYDGLDSAERPDTWKVAEGSGRAMDPRTPPQQIQSPEFAARPPQSSVPGRASSSSSQAQAQSPITMRSTAPLPVASATIPSRVDPLPSRLAVDEAEEGSPEQAPSLAVDQAPAMAQPRLISQSDSEFSSEPATESGPENDALTTIQQLIDKGRARLEAMTTYQCVLTRQERVGQSLLPEEDVVLSIRRDPQAVRLEWNEGPNRGRRVFFSPVETDGLLVVRMPSSLIPPLRLDPESPMAMNNSRHPISNAGLDPIFADIAKRLVQARQGDTTIGTISYEGQETPEGLNLPCHKIVRLTLEGETWELYLHPESHLPVLLVGISAKGDLLERHHFQDIRPNPEALADASAFDPNAGSGASGGIFGRR